MSAHSQARFHHQRNRLLSVLSRTLVVVVVGLAMVAVLPSTADPIMLADPPFAGTIFIDPDIITSQDATAFQAVTANGQGMRTMFDRRVNAFITVNAYLFNATFDGGLTAEIQVNPEFGSVAAAQEQAEIYGEVIGRLPNILRADVETVWIHMGTEPFGGGNNNLLIHTGQSALYEADGILEETLVHEAAHTSLDATHAAASGWIDAQDADAMFISTYARDNPTREDVAESFLPYLAIRYRSARISESLANTITETIPNRIAYFDSLALDIHPLQPGPPLPAMCDGKLVTINMNTNGGDGTGTTGNDVILGTPNADTIYGAQGDDTICGEGGDDKLFGAQGHDTIYGGEGDDTIHGNRGNDSLFGGGGADKIFGYAHDDTIDGGPGDDRLHGNFGDDVIEGGDGDDRIFGYGDSDTLSGGAGNDLLTGNFGDDVLDGGDGNDVLYGADGDDTVNGGNGDDQLNGNSLNDTLNGGNGNDTLDGGIDFDVCNGDAGTDTATRCETITGVP